MWKLLSRWLLVAVVFMLLFHESSFFVFPLISHNNGLLARKSIFSLSSNNKEDDQYYRKLVEEKQHDEVTDSLFAEESLSTTMVPIYLAGQGKLPISSNMTSQPKEQGVFFLITNELAATQQQKVSSSLILPMNSRRDLKLVSFAAAKRPLSKSVLLSLNMLLVNRDGALFDNLPWSTWSIDPQTRNRDAAGNAIAEKFLLGKRDAYYRFMGKDWQGRSLAIGHLALRLKYLFESDDEEKANNGVDIDEEESRTSLAIRVLKLKIRESQMELAGVESEIAIARSNQMNNLAQLENNMLELQQSIETLEGDVRALSERPEKISSMISMILEQIANWSTKDGKNAAPYRGAMGYSPMLDTKDDLDKSHLPYTSPYDLLEEILEDQLNAIVIGCVLENTSLLKGNTVLGGAIVLQRITPTKTRKIMGEEVEFEDADEDYGNIDIKGGELKIVECDADEALGISLSQNVPLKVDSSIFERMSLLAKPLSAEKPISKDIFETVPIWQPIDAELSLQIEGERQLSTNSSPISIPGNFDDWPSDSSSDSVSLFPVDSPIKSLDEYDELSNEDKAKTLLEMSNFSGKLPRPRAVRELEPNPLDQLLLPLIDEIVRKQYLIRDAERQGDTELVKELRSSKSRRQKALEKAESARDKGDDGLASQWDSESKFLESLRADSTQDEGSYNRFLDKDDWYERDRQAAAKRAKKSSFGTLLDGIE